MWTASMPSGINQKRSMEADFANGRIEHSCHTFGNRNGKLCGHPGVSGSLHSGAHKCSTLLGASLVT